MRRATTYLALGIMASLLAGCTGSQTGTAGLLPQTHVRHVNDQPGGGPASHNDQPGGGPASHNDQPGGGPTNDQPGGGPASHNDQPGGGPTNDQPGGGPTLR